MSLSLIPIVSLVVAFLFSIALGGWFFLRPNYEKYKERWFSKVFSWQWGGIKTEQAWRIAWTIEAAFTMILGIGILVIIVIGGFNN